MITTSRLVFLHLHKSGGTFVNECLLRFLPDARQVGYHLPRSMIPADARALPILGFVRNPWSYYVSWFSFQQQQTNPNFLYRILSDDGRLDFAATLRNMLDLGAGSIRLDLILRALPSSYSNQGLNLPRFALEPIRGTRLGFYSYLYRYLYGGVGGPVRIGRMEQLRDELPRLLSAAGEPPTGPMSEFIAAAAPRNTSQHDLYARYYTDELRELVAERDAQVIGNHDYTFGSELPA
ncbi:MAG TPA: hypothetical protein VKC11_11020 [Steroidobacteraceae bacterium]|nr:hypothetical protein [Steroidobacteraceae bacterium]